MWNRPGTKVARVLTVELTRHILNRTEWLGSNGWTKSATKIERITPS